MLLSGTCAGSQIHPINILAIQAALQFGETDVVPTKTLQLGFKKSLPILHIRKIGNLTYSIMSGIGNLHSSLTTLFCSNQNDTVGSPGPVYGGSRGVLQNVD